MKRKILTLTFLALTTMSWGQRIDINMSGRNVNEGTEAGYTAWTFARVKSAEGKFATAGGDSITIRIGAVKELSAANGVRTNYWKQGVTSLGYKLLADGCHAIYAPDTTNMADCDTPSEGSCGIELQIKGLKAGEHSLLAYHNATNGLKVLPPPISVFVNGNKVLSGIKQTVRATKEAEAGHSYVTFSCKEGETVTIQYVSEPEPDSTYKFTSPTINALVFDESSPDIVALDPNPAYDDQHVAADDGTYALSWKGAAAAVRHHVYFGTDPKALAEVAVVTDTTYTVSSLNNLNLYYWRIDEETSDGVIHEGTLWKFRPRHLAFRGAEGYGRFATGGRGGRVVYVTNLNSSGPGSFYDAIKRGDGPRTVLFMVSGVIDLGTQAIFADDNITVAGQSAPGKGICIAHSNLGLGNDNIWRHMRLRRGLTENRGNAMGISGCDYTIADHLSTSWGTDETVSGRNAKNVTFQYSMIAEALGISHGFAATIGGTIGSWHHNFLVNCSGRNWSMAGNVDGSGNYITRLDLFNNVCYNWWKRTTDGSAHEVNFVNNVYKMGPDSNKKILFEMQHQGYGAGTCQAYVNGNLRINKDGSITEDKLNDTYKIDVSDGVKIDYETFVDKPFFPSYATIHSAKDAYKIVLSDNGANMPLFDNHDQRVVGEAINGTWHYKGKPGYKGQIDSEDDCGGYEAYPEQSWPEGFDTDLDGLPNWFESIVGTNPNSPSEDFTDSNSDPDGDGYTLLEDYLEFMAHPHLGIKAGSSATLNLSQYFRGFTSGPVFSVIGNDDKASFSVSDSILTVKVPATAKGIVSAKMKVTDSEGSTYERPLYVAITEASITGITSVSKNCQLKTFEAYTLDGKKIASGNAEGHNVNNLPLAKIGNGVFIIKTTDSNGNVSTCKIVK